MKKETASTVVVENTKKESAGSLKESPAKVKKSYKKLIILITVLVLGGLSATFYTNYTKEKKITSSDVAKSKKELEESNKALSNNDKKQALKHAREALDANPDSYEAINTVASLTDDKEEKNKLYAHQLDLQKKQLNPDVDGLPTSTYWATAQVAAQAGEVEQAKKYYQKAIGAAKESSEYDQALSADSKTALERLK